MQQLSRYFCLLEAVTSTRGGRVSVESWTIILRRFSFFAATLWMKEVERRWKKER